MKTTSLHAGKLCMYGALSLADLFLTYRLLSAGAGRIYEGNPIASAWLHSFGWGGLVVFKLLAVFVVVAAAMCISISRPQLGGRILSFACMVVAGVVIYSGLLSRELNASEDGSAMVVQNDQAGHRERLGAGGPVTVRSHGRANLRQNAFSMPILHRHPAPPQLVGQPDAVFFK